MSYYTFTPLEAYELARAAEVNERFEQVATAFGSLPELEVILRGVKDTVLATNPVSVNAYVFTSSEDAVTSLALGQRISFKAGATSTSAATLNVDGLGAVAIKRSGGSATVAGDIVSGRVYDVIHDGTAWQLLNVTNVDLAGYDASAAASAAAASTSAGTASTQAGIATTQAGLAAAAKVAAELAETNAETAETNAETAEVNAEAAQAAAEAARDAAIVAKDAALVAETNAETAETNAETAETNAEAAEAAAAAHVITAAAHVATAAGHVTTAAGHVTTASGHATAAGVARTAAELAETNAETAETNAAAAAAAAAASAASINDANIVHLTGAETITGVKTFSAAPVMSAGLEIGNASDTSLTRTGAGDIAVEGKGLYRADGTDVAVADGGTGASTAAAARTNLGLAAVSIPFIIDGGGAAITTGIKGDIQIPFGMTITAWRVLGDQSGSIVVDIWKDTYANYPPVVGDTMTGAEKPTLSAATKAEDTSLASGAGWAVSAGDILRFNVDSATTVQRVTVILEGTR